MELRVLRYFLTVAHEKNITRAADILHITQPTLSRQLMQLEEELGVKLFLRGRNITLTEAGMLLRQRGEEIFALVDKTEKELGDKLLTGTISIGNVETLSASQTLSKLIKNFHSKYPQVNFNIYSGNTIDIKDKINSGLIDVGIILTPSNFEIYNYLRLPKQEKWGLLMPKDSPLAQKEYIVPEDLIDLPLIFPIRSSIQSELTNWFGDYYNDLHIFSTYNLIYNAVIFVKNGLGYAICLENILPNEENICFRPFFPEFTSNCLFVWKKSQTITPTVRHFIQFIKDTYKT